RPLFPGTRPEETACRAESREVDLDRESIWISYRPLSLETRGPNNLGQFSHHRLATPVSPWERLTIGCGTPPVLTRHGWLIVYHGVSEQSCRPEGSLAAAGPSASVLPLAVDHWLRSR